MEGRKLVVIEDEELLRSLVEEGLRGVGFSVSSTSDPAAAVTLVLAEAPDLVILDITSPEGAGALRDLRESSETAFYPILALTGEEGTPSEGVLDSVRKPFPVDALVEKVGALLPHLLPTRLGALFPAEGVGPTLPALSTRS